MLAARAGQEIELVSRHGRSLGRYFPELVAAFAALAPDRWTIDGEILVTADGRFDFSQRHLTAPEQRSLPGRGPDRTRSPSVGEALGEETAMCAARCSRCSPPTAMPQAR